MELEAALRESATEEEESVLSDWGREAGRSEEDDSEVEETDDEEEVVAFDEGETISTLGDTEAGEDIQARRVDTFVAEMPPEDRTDGAMPIGNAPFEIPSPDEQSRHEARSPLSSEEDDTGWEGHVPEAAGREDSGKDEDEDEDDGADDRNES